MTPTIMTGWEHGVTTITVNGGGLADVIAGAPTVVTTPVRSGTYSLEITPAGANEFVQYTQTSTLGVVQICIRFSSLPTADCTIYDCGMSDSFDFALWYIQASGKLQVRFGATSTQLSTNAISVDTWYVVDMRYDCGVNPRVCDWRIDGVDQTQLSLATAAATSSNIKIGSNSGTPTYTLYVDDFIFSATSGDYPIGGAAVVGFSPVIDGAHNAGTNVIEDNAGADIGSASAWSLINDVPLNSGSSNWVRQNATGASNYAEVYFGTMSSGSSVLGVGALLAYAASATTANNGGTVIFNSDSASKEVFGYNGSPADMSESSMFYKRAIVTPPGSGWSQAEVNLLRGRIGYSTDATPNPRWYSLLLEVSTASAAAAGGGDGLFPGMFQAMTGITF